jgi:hypothetical protein
MSKTQTPTQIQRYLHNVAWTHTGRSTIGFVRVKDNAPASLGSGTLIRFGNITGVLNCAHVLEALLGEEEIGILCFPVRATQIQRLRFDNKLALNAGWDLEMLSLEIGELGEAGFDLSLTGFDEFELGELFAERTQGRTDPDDAPEPPAHPVAEPGDLWVLGRHRLLCGDSTVATDVERVLGGVAPHLMVTDPPYGVNYDPAWRNQAGRSINGTAQRIATGTVIKPIGARAVAVAGVDLALRQVLDLADQLSRPHQRACVARQVDR